MSIPMSHRPLARLGLRRIALIVVAAVVAIAPAGAVARFNLNPEPHNANAVAACTKDYSRDSVTGGYCASDAGSVAPITAPSSPTNVVKHDDGGFSWSDAGAGAGGAIALIAVATGGAIAFRRRSPSVEARRSAATH